MSSTRLTLFMPKRCIMSPMAQNGFTSCAGATTLTQHLCFTRLFANIFIPISSHLLTKKSVPKRVFRLIFTGHSPNKCSVIVLLPPNTVLDRQFPAKLTNFGPDHLKIAQFSWQRVHRPLISADGTLWGVFLDVGNGDRTNTWLQNLSIA